MPGDPDPSTSSSSLSMSDDDDAVFDMEMAEQEAANIDFPLPTLVSAFLQFCTLEKEHTLFNNLQRR